MISDNNIASLKNYLGSEDVKFEVNFNKDNDKIRVSVGTETAVISMNDLFSFMMSIGTPEMQSDLMPIKQTTISKYIRQHRIKTKKTIKAGEELVFNCEVDVPTMVEYNLKGLIKQHKSPLIII